jgi:hypothetical protein
MKVKKLIELLKSVDPERIVVLSRDSEGNGYNEVSGYAEMLFSDGEVFKDVEELNEFGSDGKVKEAFVLWP